LHRCRTAWIAKKFTEEHRHTFDYLNKCTSGRLRLYGVEVEVLRIGASLPDPHFRLVSTPNDYVAAAHNATSELSEAKSLYMEFWTGSVITAAPKGKHSASRVHGLSTGTQSALGGVDSPSA
jgi:hypothetical protein